MALCKLRLSPILYLAVFGWLVAAQDLEVTTGTELQSAVSSGATSVVITDHLDVRGLPNQSRGSALLVKTDFFLRVRSLPGTRTTASSHGS